IFILPLLLLLNIVDGHFLTITHELISEFGCLLLIVGLIKRHGDVSSNGNADRMITKEEISDLYILSFSFITVAIGDILFNFGDILQWKLYHPGVIARELFYAFDTTFFFWYIYSSSKSVLKDGISITLMFSTMTVFLLIFFKYILTPLYLRHDPGYFHYITTTTYSVLQALTVSMVIPLIIRSKRKHTHLFLQITLFQIIGDIGIRYVIAKGGSSYSSPFEQTCQISMAAYFMLFLLTGKKPLSKDGSDIIPSYRSLRSMVAGMLTIGMSIVVFYTLYLTNNVEDLAIFFMGIFTVFFVANIFAQLLSDKFLSLHQKIPANLLSEFLADLQRICLNNEDLHKNVLKHSIASSNNIYEVNNLVNSYNKLLDQISTLFKLVATQSQEITAAQVAQEVAHDIRSPLAVLNMILRKNLNE
ncbi:MAG: hypothetical protein HQK53_17705, partial [Oligoflexia bacterium]|nr:hypothetical protein [Oligoflexia bacterium]